MSIPRMWVVDTGDKRFGPVVVFYSQSEAKKLADETGGSVVELAPVVSTEKMEPVAALDNIKAALEAGPQVLITDGYYGACNPSAIRELLAYVESLERERDEARRTMRMAHEMGTQVVAERDALQAKVESLEKDAARYRVIRNREHGFILERDRTGWRDTIPWMQGTDAAIDAAMEQTK